MSPSLSPSPFPSPSPSPSLPAVPSHTASPLSICISQRVFHGQHHSRKGKEGEGAQPRSPRPPCQSHRRLPSTCKTNYISIRIKGRDRCAVFGEKCQESAARLDFTRAGIPAEAKPCPRDSRSDPAAPRGQGQGTSHGDTGSAMGHEAPTGQTPPLNHPSPGRRASFIFAFITHKKRKKKGFIWIRGDVLCQESRAAVLQPFPLRFIRCLATKGEY